MNTRRSSRKNVFKGSYNEIKPDDGLMNCRRSSRNNIFKGSYKEDVKPLNNGLKSTSESSTKNGFNDMLKTLESDDDLSYESTSSTIRRSSESCSTLCDDDDSVDSYDDDNDVDSLQYKLERLKVTYFDRKKEHAVVKRCTDIDNVSRFLNDLFSRKKSKNSNFEKQKRTVIELYEQNRELCRRLRSVSKKSKEMTKEICHLYTRVNERTEERKKVWEEAVKMHKLNLGDSSAFLNFDDTDPFDESNFKQKEKEYLLRGIDYAVFTKSFRIVQVAKILYNLICSSDVSWGTNKKLLEILECTSKMFDRDFDLKKRKEFMSIVDEVILRLNKVKI